MKITRIIVDGYKGLTLDLPLTARNVLFTGLMGSGKSATLESVHLTLNLPTRHGLTGLNDLSPTGEWTTRLDFADGPVTRLERGARRRGSHFAVDGVKVDKDEYESAVAKVIQVDPHHVSLSEFVNLSGQKRAGLFASMMESEPVDIPALIEQTNRCDLKAYFGSTLDDVDSTLKQSPWQALLSMKAAPSELLEIIRVAVNSASASERDAKTSLDGLVTRHAASGSQQAMTPAEARVAVGKINEELGGLKARKDQADNERERYESAKKILTANEKTLAAKKAELATLTATAGDKDNREKAVKEAGATLEAADHVLAARDAALNNLSTQAKEIASEVTRYHEALVTVGKLVRQNWNVDDEWLAAEAEQMFDSIRQDGLQGSAGAGGLEISPAEIRAAKAHLLKFVREVVIEVIGGDEAKLNGKIADAGSRAAILANQAAAAEQLRADEVIKVQDGRELLHQRAQSVQAAIAAAAALPALAKAAADQETELITLQQDLEKSAPREMDAALEGRVKQLTDERARLNQIIKELESLLSLSGQVEQQRVRVAQAAQTAAALKRLQVTAQQWRDNAIRAKIAQIMGPFKSRFVRLFGEGSLFEHVSQGEGRTTEFSFLLQRPGRPAPVRLEHLSDGETVLAGAAFLSALQSVRPSAPGSLLTLNSEGLDFFGLEQIIKAGPDLGLDHLFIANNRAAKEHLEMCAMHGWQIIVLGAKHEKTPPLRHAVAAH